MKPIAILETGQPPEALHARLTEQWRELAADDRLVYFKLITGAFRVGVSKLQVTQALAAVANRSGPGASTPGFLGRRWDKALIRRWVRDSNIDMPRVENRRRL